MITRRLFVSLIALSVYANSALSLEMRLSCEKSEQSSIFRIPFACTLEGEESLIDPDLVVTSMNVNLEEVRAKDADKKIFIEIIGDERYPEAFPAGLASVVSGVEIFSYTATPLRHLKRTDFTDMHVSLFKLSLERNQIESLDHDTFHDLEALQFLSLGHNKLASLPPDLLAHSPKLVFLLVSDNAIGELAAELFIQNPQLKKFLANNNEISELHADLFLHTPELMVVGFRSNKIASIPFDFRTFNGLYVADFRDNVETCDVVYNVNELKPQHCDDECQSKTVKNIDEFQLRIEEICRN